MTGKRSWNKVSIDTYTCHCEKIEDFRGNPENTLCGSGLLRHCAPRNDKTTFKTRF